MFGLFVGKDAWVQFLSYKSNDLEISIVFHLPLKPPPSYGY